MSFANSKLRSIASAAHKWALVGASLFVSPAFGIQGATCSQAVELPIPNTIANTVPGFVGMGAGSCTNPLEGGIYTWTAPMPGLYCVNYNGLGSANRLAIFEADQCPVSASDLVGCDYHNYHGSSTIALDVAAAGTQYFVQFGNDLGAVGWVSISGRCSFPDTHVDLLGNNDSCDTGTPLGDGVFEHLPYGPWGSEFFRMCIAPGDTLDLGLVYGANEGYLAVRLRDVTAGCAGAPALVYLPYSPTSLQYTNTTNAPMDVAMEFEATWCGTIHLTVQGANGCEPRPSYSVQCHPMDLNSMGRPTTLGVESGTGLESGMRLHSRGGPPGAFASFIIGTGMDAPGIVIGDGRLCLAVDAPHRIGRYNIAGTSMNSIGIYNSAGEFENLANTSATGFGFDVPTLVPTLNQYIREGETWNFQVWHREPGGGSNWSNAIAITYGVMP